MRLWSKDDANQDANEILYKAGILEPLKFEVSQKKYLDLLELLQTAAEPYAR